MLERSEEGINHQENIEKRVPVNTMNIEEYGRHQKEAMQKIHDAEIRENGKELALSIFQDVLEGNQYISYTHFMRNNMWEKVKDFLASRDLAGDDVNLLKQYMEVEVQGLEIGNSLEFRTADGAMVSGILNDIVVTKSGDVALSVLSSGDSSQNFGGSMEEFMIAVSSVYRPEKTIS